MIDLETAERIALDETAGDGPQAVVTPIDRDVLVITGPDGAAYLQGQISQDAEGLAIGATAWTLLLQPQGKVEAWLRVHRLAEDRFLFDVDRGFGEAAKARLERFKLRVDVRIEVVTATGLAVRGPGAAAVIGPDGSLSLDAGWGGVDGVDFIAVEGGAGGDGPPPSAVDLEAGTALAGPLAAGSVVEGPPALLDIIRVVQGMPTMGRELDESTIPAAAGIVNRSVDFTKGCYVGQELVARIDSRGSNTPTRLVGLRFDESSPPEPGSDLQLDGSAAGTVTTVARSATRGSIGLGYVRRAVAVPGGVQVVDPASEAETVELPSP